MKVKSALEISDRLVSWRMLDDASDVLVRCLDAHPFHPRLLRRLGRIRLAQGRPEEAAPLLEQALAHQRLMQDVHG
ncbi:MAG: hypothetical protein KJO54_07075 [Gammaproteobacteria bacterium]|nr:hypothetical protein [Gammaproteobacteria bacterium]NNF61381.1 hypothetical protein [Gammaproteobacteria bacterium]